LYFPKRGSSFIGTACHGTAACGSAGISGLMCGDDSDLISLDRGFLDQDGLCVTDNPIAGGCRPATGKGSGIKYKVPAFFVRRRGAKHTILFSHGNAEDLGMMYKRMKDLALVLCVNVMAYDYTGYGLSCVEGDDERELNEFVEVDKNGKKMSNRDLNRSLNVPSENMIYRNIEAAYVYLTQTRGIPSRNIILYGRSLGSGPSCYLAAKTALMGESVGGLILHSPFLSVYKVVADVGVDVKGDMFNNEKRAGNIR
jgi:pimeloyl-ACP methyl ester carboxylesterase